MEGHYIDWKRRRCFVEPVDGGGKAKWAGLGTGISYDIAQGMRAVLLGEDPAGVTLTSRAKKMLADLRDSIGAVVSDSGPVVVLPAATAGRWWTWARTKANRTLQASLPEVIDPRQRIDEKSVRLMPGLGTQELADAKDRVRSTGEWRMPAVSPGAVRGLKFSVALPAAFAAQTLSERLSDSRNARRLVIAETEV